MSIAAARFALSAWVGAAALFVVTSVREVQAPELDSYVRDILIGVRFPSYYLFGFSLVGIGLLATFAAGCLAPAKRGRLFVTAGIVLVALAAMLGDYFWVYRPLVEMVTPPGQSRPAQFVDYHEASKWVNFASLSLCGLAAIVLCGHPTAAETNKP
jgi:hypothetical protein